MEEQVALRQRPERPVLPELPKTRQQAVRLWANSPAPYWNSINPRTATDVFLAVSPSVGELSRTYDGLFINSLMYVWFEEFVNFYSTNGTMDPLQIKDTIDLVLEEYPHYKPEDFKLFFKMARKGYFGQVFGRMDGEVIMNWIARYDIHRDTQAQNDSIRAADAFRPRAIAPEGKGMTRAEYEAYKRQEKQRER